MRNQTGFFPDPNNYGRNVTGTSLSAIGVVELLSGVIGCGLLLGLCFFCCYRRYRRDQQVIAGLVLNPETNEHLDPIVAEGVILRVPIGYGLNGGIPAAGDYGSFNDPLILIRAI